MKNGMTALLKFRWTPETYLAHERTAATKSEYLAGEIFAMAGASEAHNLIVTNLIACLRPQLRARGCKIYPSDMRIKISATGLYTYPDLTIVCGPARFDDKQHDVLLNPTVLCEVLSPATEAYDRDKKFEHYRRLRSLTEYLLIAQDVSHVEHYVRQPDDRWLLTEVRETQDVITLSSVGCRVALADVYEQVEIPAAAGGPGATQGE